MTRRFFVYATLAHAAFALLLNAPCFTGKVPLPVDITNSFPPWDDVPEARVDRSTAADLGDLVTQIYPWRMWAAEELRKGELPIWNPYLLGGTPFIANSQSAIFYPFNWLYIAAPAPVVWTVLFVLKTALAGFFASTLGKALGMTTPAAICSGFVFTGSGFMTAWRGYPMGDAAIWLPLGLFGVMAVRERATAGATVLLAVALAMPVLSGHPETAAHITLAVVAFGAVQFFQIPKEGRKEGRKRRCYLVFFFSAAVLSLGFAAAQMIPTLEWLRQTAIHLDVVWPARPAGRIIAFISRDLSRNPNNMGLDIPEDAAYAGIVTLFLVPFAFMRRPRSTAAFFLAAALVCVAIVYGIPPIRWLSTKIPVFSGLKNGRLVFVVGLCLAVLMGLGFSALITIIRRRGISHLAAMFLAAAVTLDMFTFTFGFMPFVPANAIYPPSPIFDFLKKKLQAGDRIAGVDSALPINIPMLYGLKSIDGYDIDLRDVDELLYDWTKRDVTGIGLDSSQVAEASDRRLNMMSVRYLIASAFGDGADRLSAQRDRFTLVHSFGALRILENKRALNKAVLVPASNAEILPSLAAQRERLHHSDFDPSSSVLLFTVPVAFPTSILQAPAGVEAITFPSANQIGVRVHAREKSILVSSEVYYPGWQVTVDGVKQPLLRANGVLMATALGPGTHEVLFEIHSKTVTAGIWLSLFTVAVSIVIWVRPHSGPVLTAGISLVAAGLVFAATAIDCGVPPQGPLPAVHLSRTNVVAGRDSYILTIAALPKATAILRFNIDGGAISEFSVPLDDRGQIKIDVPLGTRKGKYRIVGFRKAGASVWEPAEAIIVVE